MRVRRRIALSGIVQGVGLRPWALRRARTLGLTGFVRNQGSGVALELDGDGESIDAWLRALRADAPAHARIESIEVRDAPVDRVQPDAFRIEASRVALGSSAPARIPPDLALCEPCQRELFDAASRRHRYAFLHCATCGPRASVLLGLPYDRERTTLRDFPPCAACRDEYADPGDRRYHAQTLACPDCGPVLTATQPDGGPAQGDPGRGDPIEWAASRIASGGCVALKGYGGFHLLVDGCRPEAVARLRKRKGRPVKPFAVLVPDLAAARALVHLTSEDEELLAGPRRAVVVAPRRPDRVRDLGLADAVAPGTGDLGVILPVAPVHWLLLYGPGAQPGSDPARFPALVFTSANRSEAPTVHDDEQARAQLGEVADGFVGHDRRVARPSDDPVFRSGPFGPIPLRLSRATAPLALRLPAALTPCPPIAAVGGDLKCAPALASGGEILLGEHVGDLNNAESADALEDRLANLARLASVRPALVAHDLHPGYTGTQLAEGFGLPRIAVQHHHAHAAANLVENGHTGPALALVLDGAGHGADGSVWGGELLWVSLERFRRLAWLEPVPLPGGDAAVREPWRMAAVWLARAFPEGPPRLPWHDARGPELARVLKLAASGYQSPLSSSCGRLFDAVASLLGLGDRASHEGELAMALESCAAAAQAPAGETHSPAANAEVIPAADLVRDLALALADGTPSGPLARVFHARLAARLAAATLAAARETGLRHVALSGGCFQNRLLLADLHSRLSAAGLTPLLHTRLPPNDAALAVGQAAVAACAATAGTLPDSFPEGQSTFRPL